MARLGAPALGTDSGKYWFRSYQHREINSGLEVDEINWKGLQSKKKRETRLQTVVSHLKDGQRKLQCFNGFIEVSPD